MWCYLVVASSSSTALQPTVDTEVELIVNVLQLASFERVIVSSATKVLFPERAPHVAWSLRWNEPTKSLTDKPESFIWISSFTTRRWGKIKIGVSHSEQLRKESHLGAPSVRLLSFFSVKVSMDIVVFKTWPRLCHRYVGHRWTFSGSDRLKRVFISRPARSKRCNRPTEVWFIGDCFGRRRRDVGKEKAINRSCFRVHLRKFGVGPVIQYDQSIAEYWSWLIFFFLYCFWQFRLWLKTAPLFMCDFMSRTGSVVTYIPLETSVWWAENLLN